MAFRPKSLDPFLAPKPTCPMVAFSEKRRREIHAIIRTGVVPEWLWSIRRGKAGWIVRYEAEAGRCASRTFADETAMRPGRPDLAAEVSLYDALRFRTAANALPNATNRQPR